MKYSIVVSLISTALAAPVNLPQIFSRQSAVPKCSDSADFLKFTAQAPQDTTNSDGYHLFLRYVDAVDMGQVASDATQRQNDYPKKQGKCNIVVNAVNITAESKTYSFPKVCNVAIRASRVIALGTGANMQISGGQVISNDWRETVGQVSLSNKVSTGNVVVDEAFPFIAYACARNLAGWNLKASTDSMNQAFAIAKDVAIDGARFKISNVAWDNAMVQAQSLLASLSNGPNFVPFYSTTTYKSEMNKLLDHMQIYATNKAIMQSTTASLETKKSSLINLKNSVNNAKEVTRFLIEQHQKDINSSDIAISNLKVKVDLAEQRQKVAVDAFVKGAEKAKQAAQAEVFFNIFLIVAGAVSALYTGGASLLLALGAASKVFGVIDQIDKLLRNIDQVNTALRAINDNMDAISKSTNGVLDPNYNFSRPLVLREEERKKLVELSNSYTRAGFGMQALEYERLEKSTPEFVKPAMNWPIDGSTELMNSLMNSGVVGKGYAMAKIDKVSKVHSYIRYLNKYVLESQEFAYYEERVERATQELLDDASTKWQLALGEVRDKDTALDVFIKMCAAREYATAKSCGSYSSFGLFADPNTFVSTGRSIVNQFAEADIVQRGYQQFGKREGKEFLSIKIDDPALLAAFKKDRSVTISANVIHSKTNALNALYRLCTTSMDVVFHNVTGPTESSVLETLIQPSALDWQPPASSFSWSNTERFTRYNTNPLVLRSSYLPNQLAKDMNVMSNTVWPRHGVAYDPDRKFYCPSPIKDYTLTIAENAQDNNLMNWDGVSAIELRFVGRGQVRNAPVVLASVQGDSV